MPDVSAVIVTYNARPWIERSIESIRDGVRELIVVDHGSADGTVELVRERFPEARVLERENRGFGAGNNAGMREASGDYVLLLNPDAWFLGDGLETLVAFAEEHPEAGVVGPKLLHPDGSLQRSVRGDPTPWRIATEWLFLRKLAPHSRVFNAYHGGPADYESVYEAEWLGGACLLVRRTALDEVGGFDEDFFLFSEELDWCYRFRQHGWKVLFFPGAEVTHVIGASHDPRRYTDLVVSQLRFLQKHRGEREAERARRVFVAALQLRGLVFRGARGRMYREASQRLRSGKTAALLESRG
jgi:N-acetylglucosaminyl-diphospho-decaprenol L-rhamnosyltransferase